MRVLVTGGAGFIGSHICDALVESNQEVFILDNLTTGSKKNIAHLGTKINLIQGDIRDEKIVESLVKDCDLVLHMAAALGVDNILENPIEAISTNFHGSEVILTSCSEFNKRIIIASTSEIYGKSSKQPLSESDDRVIGTPQKLRWTYSDAKALEEAIAYSLYLNKKLPVSTVRFFNTVGPRQTGKYGMVVPRFVQSALKNEPLNVFGDGQQTRVFCHVKEATQALLMLTSSDNTIGEVYNIGGKDEISILELAKLIIRETNSKSSVRFVPYSEAYSTGFEETIKRIPDLSKIKSTIGWEPKFNITQIIKDVISSFS